MKLYKFFQKLRNLDESPVNLNTRATFFADATLLHRQQKARQSLGNQEVKSLRKGKSQ